MKPYGKIDYTTAERAEMDEANKWAEAMERTEEEMYKAMGVQFHETTEAEKAEMNKDAREERSTRGKLWNTAAKIAEAEKAENAEEAKELERRFNNTLQRYARKWPHSAEPTDRQGNRGGGHYNQLPPLAKKKLLAWKLDREARAAGITEYATIIKTKNGNEIFLLTKDAESITARIESHLKEREGRKAGGILDQRTESEPLNQLYKEAIEAANRAARKAELKGGAMPIDTMRRAAETYRRAGGARRLPCQQEKAIRKEIAAKPLRRGPYAGLKKN